MLTQRQINILMYLLNVNDWTTSETLSSSLNLNKKTIQTEIKEIKNQLKNDVILSISKHKGYHIEHVSEQGLHTLILELNRHESRNCLPPRQSTLILYFLYLKSYISMQSLADIFFMSKTAISLEVGVIKRWIDRYDGLTLEINNKKGIKLHANEDKKRIYCSKHGTLKAFKSLPFPNELKEEYEYYLQTIKTIISNICIHNEFIITGEDLQKTTQYLASSVIRSRMGYNSAKETMKTCLNKFMTSIKEHIFNELNYSMTSAEIMDLQMILNESDFLINPNEDKKNFTKEIKLFLKKIREISHVDFISDAESIQTLNCHINSMFLRHQSGDIAINHYNEEIVLQYPLEVFLAYQLFCKIFFIEVSKETSFIALFISSYISRYKHQLSVLFVCDQNLSIIQSIQTNVQSLSIPIKSFQSMPAYQYENNPSIRKNYDILLTTDQKTVLTDSSFFLISPIMSVDDFEYVQQYIHKKLIALKKEKIHKFIKECLVTIHLKEIMNTPFEILLNPKDNTEHSYHTFSEDKLYICHISKTAVSSIQDIMLKEATAFLHKRIKRIIYVQFHEGDDDMFSFFDAVSEVLNKYK